MYRILNYTRIKPRLRPPQKKQSAYFMHPEFSAAKIEKKVRKLCEQIRYYPRRVCPSVRKEKPQDVSS
jgi:hypothetical protein